MTRPDLARIIKFPTKRPPGAEHVRRLICSAGLTQEQAAELFGVSPRHLRRVLNGQRKCPWLEGYVLLEELVESRRAA